MGYLMKKKMAEHKNNKKTRVEKTLRERQGRSAGFYAVPEGYGRYVPEQTGTDEALAYTHPYTAKRNVVQRKIKVGVSLRLDEDEQEVRPLDQYIIDTVKLAERADTGLKNYKSGGTTQGAHTIADVFVKKYQKEMLKGSKVDQAYNFYGNEFQTMQIDNAAFLSMYNVLFRDDNAAERIQTLCSLQAGRKDQATVTHTENLLKAYEEEMDRKSRLESSNEWIGKGQALIAGKNACGTSTQVRKDLVELISIYNEAYAQSALSTCKVGTRGRGEAGGMHNIKKYMSVRQERQEGEDRSKLLPHFAPLLDRDSVHSLEGYAQDLGSSIVGESNGNTGFAVIDNSFRSLVDAVQSNIINNGIEAYFGEEIRPEERAIEWEREKARLEMDMAVAFWDGFMQCGWQGAVTKISQLLSPYAEFMPNADDIICQQFGNMARNEQFVRNMNYLPMWFAKKRAGGLSKRFDEMLYTLDDKYRSDQEERELDEYSRDLFLTVDWISKNREKLSCLVTALLNTLKEGDVCSRSAAAESEICRFDIQDYMEMALNEFAAECQNEASFPGRLRTQLGRGNYIDQLMQDILQEVVSGRNESDESQQMICDGWVLKLCVI